MAKFELSFDTDNDAFHDNEEQEIIDILNRVINKILSFEDSGAILDTNGNSVGYFLRS